MKATFKYFSSPDVELDGFHPQDPENFSFLLEAIVGPVGVSEAGESIQFIVCTPLSLKEQLASDGVVFGRSLVIVDSPNVEKIMDRIRRAIEALEAPTSEELAHKFSRLGVYEFEDYFEPGSIG